MRCAARVVLRCVTWRGVVWHGVVTVWRGAAWRGVRMHALRASMQLLCTGSSHAGQRATCDQARQRGRTLLQDTRLGHVERGSHRSFGAQNTTFGAQTRTFGPEMKHLAPKEINWPTKNSGAPDRTF